MGSNRRPPPCQISNPSEMARHPRRPSDKERQYLCGFNASFPASYLSLSEIKRTPSKRVRDGRVTTQGTTQKPERFPRIPG